jgi:hypothetical protein
MKNILSGLALIICMIGLPLLSEAQNNQATVKTKDIKVGVDTTQTVNTRTYQITTSDGNEFFGTIISQDSKEVLIETKNMGQVSIPKYQITEIKEMEPGKENGTGERFSTRYFITTNGLPIKKGENYIIWNLYGPDIQFGVTDHLGVGIMTSWVGIPIIGTAKYSFNLGKNTSMSLGTLIGTGSYAAPKFAMVVPFAALTFGDSKRNINFSGGYGAVWTESEDDGRVLLSVAGMTSVSKKASLVFDSFIIPAASHSKSLSIIIPGFRLETNKGKFFQFGFGAVFQKGENVIPFPMIQLFQHF